ncbi:MAG: deoxynucleoside kinase [Oscillospiraceae bacterium]|jgi:dTMP kinase|nr:deoxynucleoside kinase [Oscillospiraceae bacterium]
MKIIVFEGLDGSGKRTQSEILTKKLLLKNFDAKLISMPNYESLSSGPIRIYLNRELGENACEVNAYAASSFFAVDRFINYIKYWKNFYEKENSIVICDRYTTSNMIYQLAKINKKDRDKFLDWLVEYEYQKLKIPKPDLVIYLKVPIEISQNLLKSRYCGNYFKQDLHEFDKNYLKQCEIAAQYLAEKYSWQIIDCSANGCEIDKLEEISEKIWNIIYSKINN